MIRGALLFGAILAFAQGLAAQTLRDAAGLDAEGKCDEAEKYCQSALAQGPPSQALLNNAGNHYLICGETEKARTYFANLLQRNPAHANHPRRPDALQPRDC